MDDAGYLVSLTVGVATQDQWEKIWRAFNELAPTLLDDTTSINVSSQDLSAEGYDRETQEEDLSKLAVTLRENGHAEKEIFGVVTTLRQSGLTISIYERE